MCHSHKQMARLSRTFYAMAIVVKIVMQGYGWTIRVRLPMDSHHTIWFLSQRTTIIMKRSSILKIKPSKKSISNQFQHEFSAALRKVFPAETVILMTFLTCWWSILHIEAITNKNLSPSSLYPYNCRLLSWNQLSHSIDQTYQIMNSNYLVRVKIVTHLVQHCINTHRTPADFKLEILIFLASFH